MELFTRGLSSWTCSGGGRKGVRYTLLTVMKNTITPHKHRHSQVNLSVTYVGAIEVYEGTTIYQKVTNLLNFNSTFFAW
jgi:hypothetical protein